MRSADYLASRGLADVGRRYGVRVEKIGARARRYGLHDAAAAEALAVFIQYQNGDDRLRLIDAARFPGGKYRGVAGSRLDLYDPCGCLVGDTRLEKLILIEGELNLLSVLAIAPHAPVVALPGKRSLKPDLAARLAGIGRVLVWIDRDGDDFPEMIAGIGRRLLDSGVKSVYVVPDADGQDANDLLVNLGPEAARQRLRELLGAARAAGAFEPPPARIRQMRTPRAVAQTDGLRDQLASIEAGEWLERLLGLDTSQGRKIACPVHDERTPSCHVYADHIYCHGCGVQFDLFSLAGYLWDLDTRSADGFKELLARLAALFNLSVARVAA